ncbi:MAG TPA: hypothetical protein VF084_06655 [Nitrososphaeraceae archaeon]
MIKNSIIIIGTFLLISILILGAPSQIKAYPFGDNSKLSIESINQLLDLQVDRDKGDSSSDKGDSSSDKANVGSNEGSTDNIENSTPDFSNPRLEEDNGNNKDENKENSNADSLDFVSEGENTNDKTPTFLKEPSGASDMLDTDPTEDNPPQTGEDNPPQTGEDTTDQSKDKNDIKKKINGEFEKITKIISKSKNKVIVKDDDDNEKEIIIVGDPTCPTQSENVALSGIINPQGIRLLANFYPCTVENGGITMNIPDSPNLKLALIYIDNNNDNHAGTLITPNKIQSIENNQGLFSIELDKKMEGIDPITGETTTLDKINGLALYNNGNEPLEFKVGSSAALTTTFTK